MHAWPVFMSKSVESERRRLLLQPGPVSFLVVIALDVLSPQQS
jgi:hypothetical protein